MKRPYVTVIGAFSLAFGIGATTAIFSLYYQTLLRPLPVPQPGALVNLSAPGPKAGGMSCGDAGDCEYVFSYPLFRDLEKEQTSFEGIAGHVKFEANLASKGVTKSGLGMMVSGSYFNVLGLRPTVGRLLGPEDDVPGDSSAVVLSHAFWRSQFAESPDVLGKALTVNGQALTIVGVAPEGFTGTTFIVRPEVFVPVTLRERMQPSSDGGRVGVFENRQRHWLYLFARLKPGVSMATAESVLNAPFHRIITDVEAPAVAGAFSAQGLERFRAKKLLLEDGRRGQSSFYKEGPTPMNLLFGVAGMVLLIVCANLANLLLAQSAERSAEIAIRASIGANRHQLVSQLLAESSCLALMGGIGALLVARWTVDVVLMIVPESVGFLDHGIQPAVLLFTAAITVAAGFAFGLLPALKATGPERLSILKAQRTSGSRATSRFRTGLATVQIALSMILLIFAGLFTKSLLNINRVDLGLKVEDVVVFAIAPELNGYTPARSLAFFERLEEELRTLPGVTGVAAGKVGVLSGDNWGNDISVEGMPDGPDVDRHSSYNSIGPNYFGTLGMRFKSGRDFTPADATGQPKVVIVNEEFARKFNLGPNPVGKRLKIGRGNAPFDMEVVGLVQNARYADVTQEIPPVVFEPYRQRQSGSINFYVRSTTDPASLFASISAVVARVAPNVPISDAKTLARQAQDSTAENRLMTVLSTAFALLATLIAAVGLYGVLAYTVAQRTREIGVRMAVGATPGQIRSMILGQVGKMVLIGGLVGLGVALGVGRLVQSLLFEMSGDDPAVLVTASLFLAVVVLAAGFIPAYRASKLHPVEALRYE